MALTPQWMDELRSRITLSSLIGRTIRVQKAGREFKACCPFHNEKSPSFTINDEKGFYHCFGCGAHGDAIRWMTDQRGMPFMDAVKELAAEAGLEVPAADPRAAQKAEERAGLHDVMAAAQEWFVDNLNGLEGAEARAYLDRRGISAAVAQDFGFGFAPDSRGRLKRELARFDVPMLIEAGMLISVEDKEPYDRFRGRLMIPIKDVRGRVIAFGGRILGAGEPKYLNSPDTPLFDKGRTLYNLNNALPASRQSGMMLVVEGYMDAIALAAAGLPHVVAPLGTALTETQIEMLWRSVERPALCFDGDNAGQKAAMRAATRALPLLRPGHSLDFVLMPQGQDPDDVLRAQGKAAMESLINARIPLVDLLWRHELNAAPLSTPEEKAHLRTRLRTHVEGIADKEVRRHYADAFEEQLQTLFARTRPAFTPRPAGQKWQGGRGLGKFTPGPAAPLTDTKDVGQSGMMDTLPRAVIAGLLRYPARIEPHFEALMGFTCADVTLDRLLAWLITKLPDKETLDEKGLDILMGDTQLYNCARELLRADGLRFTFTLPQSSADGPKLASDPVLQQRQMNIAMADLDEAIRVMVTRPMLIATLAEATALFERDMTDESFAEQQRLRRELNDLDGRLADLMQRDDD
jgi:DNA primase